MRLHEMVREAPAASVAQGWCPLGPTFIPHGQTRGRGPGSRPPVSGRISSVAIDPNNADHILIGAGGGGVWETRDGARTWYPRTDNQASLAIGAVAFNPSNPAIVYAGTGEGNSFARLGAGLLRSTDGGTTWAPFAAGLFVGIGFYGLVVDPLDASHLMAATTGGLYESADGCATWTVRRGQRTWDLSMHPVASGDANSTQEVLAGCSDGVRRSVNGGTTWNAVTLPGVPSNFRRIAVCHAPSDGNVAYVFVADSGGGGQSLAS